MTVHVALIQLNCSRTESVAERVERGFELIDAAAKDGAQLVVLPELWHVGAFELDLAREHAQPIDGPLVAALGEAAARNGVWLHGGSFCEKDGGEHHNTSAVFAPDGALVTTYRKIHLFGFSEGEPTLMTGGDELVVVDTPLGATGLATCYDLRFPELFRALTEGGAEAFVVTSGWPTPRIGHWDVLVQARAIENQAWMIACNEVGQQTDIALGGHSMVVSPTGEVVARAGDGEEILHANVDPSAVSTWRAQFPVLNDIRIG